MRFTLPNNPKTGKPAVGTCDTIPGVALVQFNPDGSAGYVGETKVDWDGQRTVTDKNGRVQLIDQDGNTWFSEMTE